MQLVESHIIRKNDPRWAELDALGFAAKNLYNLTNYHIRQEFFKTRKTLSWGKLDKLLQKQKPISRCAKVSQLVIKSVTECWSVILKRIRLGALIPKKLKAEPRSPRYKHKENGRYVLQYNLQAIGKTRTLQGNDRAFQNQHSFLSRCTPRLSGACCSFQFPLHA
ncbi:MAG: hypothetical protein U0Y68_06080 [Blastocatellia bacterium]